LVRDVDASLLPPKQIGTDCDKSMRRIPIAHVAHELINAKDFLQHDHAWTIATGRQREVSIELATVE
jgi:hypothetical protein